MSIEQLGTLVERFGFPVAALIFALYSGKKRWWVFGWTYDEKTKQIEKLEADVKEWKRLTFNALGVGDRASRVAEQTLVDAAEVTRTTRQRSDIPS